MVLNRAELLLQAKNYAGSGAWLDESGNGHDAQLGSTSGADTNDPLFKSYDGTQYLYLPGTSGNYLSTENVNLLDADSAHVEQSIGKWQVRAQSDGLSLVEGSGRLFGSQVVQFDADSPSGQCSVRLGPPGSASIPAAVSTQYTVAFRVKSITAERSGRLFVDYNNGGSYVGESGGSGTTLTEGEWVWVQHTFTTPGSSFDNITPYLLVTNAADDDRFHVDVAFYVLGAATVTDALWTPSLRIVGDLDLRAKFAATDATPSSAEYLLSTLASNTGYAMSLGTGGELVVYHGTGSGNRQETSSGLSIADGDIVEVKSVMDISAGTWTHYKDGVQFDTSGSFSTSAGSPSGTSLVAGAVVAGTSGNWDGDIYHIEVRDGIDGPVVARYDAADAAEPFATQTGDTGRTWTYNRSASGYVSTVVDRDMFLLSTDDYFEIADDAALDFAETEPFTLMALVRTNTVAAGQDVAVAKKDDLTTAAGYALGRTTAASQTIIGDGTADDDDTTGTMVTHTLYTIAGVRNITDDDVEAFLSGAGSGTPTTDSTTATLANALPLRIGATSGTAANFWEGQIIAVALWREALSDADIVTAGNELLGIFESPSSGRLLVLGLL